MHVHTYFYIPLHYHSQMKYSFSVCEQVLTTSTLPSAIRGCEVKSFPRCIHIFLMFGYIQTSNLASNDLRIFRIYSNLLPFWAWPIITLLHDTQIISQPLLILRLSHYPPPPYTNLFTTIVRLGHYYPPIRNTIWRRLLSHLPHLPLIPGTPSLLRWHSAWSA